MQAIRYLFHAVPFLTSDHHDRFKKVRTCFDLLLFIPLHILVLGKCTFDYLQLWQRPNNMKLVSTTIDILVLVLDFIASRDPAASRFGVTSFGRFSTRKISCNNRNDWAAGSYDPFKPTEERNPSALVRDRIKASLDTLAIWRVWTASQWCALGSTLCWKSCAWRLGRIASGRFAVFVKFACSSRMIGTVNGLVWWPPSKRRSWCRKSTSTIPR